MSTTRIYVVSGPITNIPAEIPARLVEAANPAQALRHVTRTMFAVAAAGALDVARLMGEGVKVEQASGAE